MLEHDIVYVAVAPPDKIEASLVKEVASVIDKDLHLTRLLLAGKIPRIVSHYQTTSEAETVAQRLRVLGLVVIICNDSELRKPSTVSFKAHTMEPGEGEVTFKDEIGGTRKITAQDVFLIINGTMRTHIEKASSRVRRKFNLPASLMTGGIPIWDKVTEKTKSVSTGTQSFVRLYGRNSLVPIVDISQNSFDYSFLGARMASSSLTNLNITIAELKNRFPDAAFDDRLIESLGVDVPFCTPADEIEINCKLIYLNLRAVRFS